MNNTINQPTDETTRHQLRAPRWTLPAQLKWLCDKGNGYGVLEPINISLTGLCAKVSWQVRLNQQWMVRVCGAEPDAWVFCPARVVTMASAGQNETLVGLKLQPVSPAQQLKLEACAQQWIAALCQAPSKVQPQVVPPTQVDKTLLSQGEKILDLNGQPLTSGAVRPASLPAAASAQVKRLPLSAGESFTLHQSEQTEQVCLLTHTREGLMLVGTTAFEIGSCWMAHLRLAQNDLPPVIWPLRIVACQKVEDGASAYYRLECRLATIAMAQWMNTQIPSSGPIDNH